MTAEEQRRFEELVAKLQEAEKKLKNYYLGHLIPPGIIAFNHRGNIKTWAERLKQHWNPSYKEWVYNNMTEFGNSVIYTIEEEGKVWSIGDKITIEGEKNYFKIKFFEWIAHYWNIHTPDRSVIVAKEATKVLP